MICQIINIRGYHNVFMNNALKHLPVLLQFFSLMGEDVNMLHKKLTTYAACTCTHGILNVVDEIKKAGAEVNLSKT